MKALWFASVLVALTIMVSCATYSQLFVSPSGEIKSCTSTGTGLVGMATASNSVGDCKEQMLAIGCLEIERAGVIGIIVSNSAPGSPVSILKVDDASPAQAAGILPGDIIVKIEGRPIQSVQDATVLLFGEAGTDVKILIRRGEQETDYTIKRASRSEVYGQPKTDSDWDD